MIRYLNKGSTKNIYYKLIVYIILRVRQGNLSVFI